MIVRFAAGLALCVGLVLASVVAAAEPPPTPSPSPSPSPSNRPPAVTPPTLLVKTVAIYPPAALIQRVRAEVMVAVTIAIDGTQSDLAVVQSGGADFDDAALEALATWQFAPALQDGTPVAARITVPFAFEPPPFEPAPAPVAPNDPAPAPNGPTGPVLQAKVRGKRVPPPRAMFDLVLDRELITAAPHKDPGHMLLSAPGVYVAKPEGDAVAHQVFLRGFDAEHGQDIGFSLGPVPLNQPSHIHGQGYADLNFIIAETVRALRVTEGVYDPRQGDFAVAGSINFDLGVLERGVTGKLSYGSFDTWRTLVMWAPEDEPDETFTAVELRRTGGFGDNRGSQSASGIGQAEIALGDDWELTLQLAAASARSNISGVVRLDDITAGRLDWYDGYSDPSASAQSAYSSRVHLSALLAHPTSSGARSELGFWFAATNFRVRQNLTGFLERSETHAEWVGRGDLIEQGHGDLAVGGHALFRTERLTLADIAAGNFELGLSFRRDGIDQVQNLLSAPQNETWDQRVDATVSQLDIGVYADLDWTFWKVLHLRGGLRADALTFDIDDRLGNFIPSFARETHILGFRRTALGVAFGPRATLAWDVAKNLSIQASYGRGYRSPQARTLTEGENAPFATVDSFEAGVRIASCDGKSIVLTAAAYSTSLSSDLAFDPGAGRLENIGPTNRTGFVAQVTARPWAWALLSASVTYVDATLTSPPTATADNPVPAFEEGQLLPYVPPLVARADLAAHGTLWRLGDDADDVLTGKAGLGFTMLSKRPLPYGQYGDVVALLDLSASLRWRAFELGLEVYNVADSRWAASEYSFVSDWGQDAIPSLVPTRHISAGEPRTLLVSLGVHL